MNQRSSRGMTLPLTTNDATNNSKNKKKTVDPPTTSVSSSSSSSKLVDPPAPKNMSSSSSSSSTTPYKPSLTTYRTLVAGLLLYSVIVGYWVASKPKGWKNPFSWHPFLMTVGYVGCMGTAAVTKKLGGYTNTKLHGILASLGFFSTLGGFYAIYRNKNLWERPHFTSLHGKMGLAVLLFTVPPMLAGGIFLHPDWGVDKTNKLYRSVHKQFSRFIMASAWCTAVYGFYSMSKDPLEVLLYAGPLLVLAPFVVV